MPHRIRLRGPWEYDSLMHCFTRRFHQPTGLTAASRVWLVIEEAAAAVRVELNGIAIGEADGQTARFDISAHLQPQNLLAITLMAPPEPTKNPSEGGVGLVSLEIEEASA